MEYLLIFAALLLTTSGQLLQKLAADKADKLSSETSFLNRIFSQGETWWAILCLGIGMLLWLAVLYRMEVSKAFPYLSLGYVLVLLVSHYYLHEVVPPTRWLGVIFIVVGISIISLT